MRGESAMHGGWWSAHAHIHKRFFFSYLFLSPKYILLINHFPLHLFMQNSYSDNRCLRGLVSYFVRRCLRVHTSHPGTNVIYNISFRLSLRSFARISSFFAPLRYLVPFICPYSPVSLPSSYNHSDFSTVDSRSTVA